MNKFLIYAFIVSIFIQGSSYSFNISDIRNYFLFDAIENTVNKIDTTNADPITTIIVNKAKVNALKKQLELRQKELEEVKASSDFILVKWYKKKQLEDKIADIENQIKVLENQ